MMKLRSVYFCLAASLAAFAACDKLPENGKLDGMWQVMEISYNPTGAAYDSVVDKKNEQIYWAFQLDLMSIRAKSSDRYELTDNFLSRFSHSGSRLDVYDIHYHEWNVIDSLITDEHTTAYCPYGILGNKASFQVELLTDKRMCLRSDYARITFRKF